MATTDNSTFSKWLYSHYFEFVTEMDKNLTVRCTLCAGGRPRQLSTAKNSTSNLKKHLERVHSNLKCPICNIFTVINPKMTPMRHQILRKHAKLKYYLF